MKKTFTKLFLTAAIFLSANNFCHAETLQELQNRLNVEAEEYFARQQLNDENVMSIAWAQNSAEYRALCYQAYNAGKKVVDDALQVTHEKPIAIIMDLDETIFNSTAYNAISVGSGRKYPDTEWDDWAKSGKAAAMPGAVDFTKYVASQNVEIFYVTNLEFLDSIIKNLHYLGFPFAERNHILNKTDTGNKQSRFDEVAKNFEVVMYVGDNAGDFPLGTYNKSVAERNSIIDKNKNDFGTKFIALPNPVYGAWENALADSYKKLSATEKISARKNSLKGWGVTRNKIAGLLKKTKTAKNTSQIILVDNNNLSLWNKNSAGDWQQDFETFCGHGSGGFNENRREGDASTPVGSFPILYAFGVGENPGTKMEYKQITQNSWLSAESDNYNTWVESETPLQNGEHLIEVYQYTYGMNIGFNVNPAVVGRGSAVFLHCKGLGRWTTAAGVCVREDDMIKLLKLAKEGAYIIIVPSIDDITKY